MRFILCFLLLISVNLFSQSLEEESSNANNNIFNIVTKHGVKEGNITINQDKAIENLLLKYVEYKQNNNKIAGYRIRIYSSAGSSARSKAYQERDRFVELYPKFSVYIEYEVPNFKVYIGDFRNRQDAYKAYLEVSKEFKNAFIVPTFINLPKID
jgi:hypothetical protein